MTPSTTALNSHHFSAILIASEVIYSWTEADFVRLLQQTVQQVGFTLVGQLAFTFQPQGVSAVALLAESHVALHFWPDKGKVTIDIHVCDYQQNNQPKAKQLAQLLTLEISGEQQSDRWHCLSITS